MANQDVVNSPSRIGGPPVAGVFERQVARFSEHYDLRLDQRTFLYWQGYVDGPITKTCDFKIYSLEDARKTLHSLAEKHFALRGIHECSKKLEDLDWEVF
jgi:hypothetical protein